MEWRHVIVAALAGATLALAASGASATTTHTEFGAHLAGMGERGTVNLHVASGKLCWAFDIPRSRGSRSTGRLRMSIANWASPRLPAASVPMAAMRTATSS